MRSKSYQSDLVLTSMGTIVVKTCQSKAAPQAYLDLSETVCINHLV